MKSTNALKHHEILLGFVAVRSSDSGIVTAIKREWDCADRIEQGTVRWALSVFFTLREAEPDRTEGDKSAGPDRGYATVRLGPTTNGVGSSWTGSALRTKRLLGSFHAPPQRRPICGSPTSRRRCSPRAWVVRAGGRTSEATPANDLEPQEAPESVSTTNIQPINGTTFPQCMEQLQEGYVFSIAATAGCLVEPIQRDLYGLDITFVRPRGSSLEETSLHAQLKNTTTKAPDPAKASFSFQFKRRAHFEHLAKARSTIKAILLVMVTDPDQSKWTDGDHESLLVRKCCYWMNLEGHTASAQHPTVQVPTSQIFSAGALTSLLDRIETGQPL